VNADMAHVDVIRAGLLSTVQDLGRWGWQAWGVPVAGPMDPRGHRLSNALVGNSPDAATLEITLVGPELVFGDERHVAVCGAQFALTVDDRPVPCGEVFQVRRGGRLKFGNRSRGARAYVAVDGGFTVDKVFGSRATHVPTRLGGAGGRQLAAGDRLPLGPASGARRRRARPALLDIPAGHARVRILPSPHAEYFQEDALEVLQSAPYRLRSESDRMGYRLEGTAVGTASAGDMLSEASPLGSIQVPPDGQPILLMADRQTTGGYPKLATVITADIGLAGQLGPGDSVTFAACNPQAAMAALIAQERLLMAAE
jgi:antagonist of KipI